MGEASSSSNVMALALPQHQVFVNFRGKELRNTFVSHLKRALTIEGINIFIDTNERKGKSLNVLFERIEESRIALAIFSGRYTESQWCLNELVKMKECKDKGKLVIIPIFYNIEAFEVRRQEGHFGYLFNNLCNVHVDKREQWSEALSSVSDLIGFWFDGMRDESIFINGIVEEVKRALSEMPLEETRDASVNLSENTSMHLGRETYEIYGLKQRLEELEEKLNFNCQETRILGVVGMPGIGKTTLARELYDSFQCKFVSHCLIQDINRASKELGLGCLRKLLLEELLGVGTQNITSTQCAYNQLNNCKVLVVLDDVSNREQIDVLLGSRDWIKQGSRIVIATSDKSLIQDMVHCTYVVPQLNLKDGLGHFGRCAFDPHSNKHNNQVIMKLSKEFVHYARGHPLALKLLGADLNGKDEDHWKTKLALLKRSSSPNIQDVLEVSYDELSQKHKDIFLDVACFRSEDESYVASLLDSSEAASGIQALMNKFMINISDGRVEMHDLLYTFARELGRKAYAQAGRGHRHRLWHHQDITDVLKNVEEGEEVRGIFLNMNEMRKEMSIHSKTFQPMHDLRYLKIYSSRCPQQCKPNNKINLPDGLNLPLKEIRYLHWLEFPLKEVPSDFISDNLVDLNLSYSKIERIWNTDKVTPTLSKLKWVNLSHSSNLRVLSGLSKAHNLQRLSLEGCIAITTLPHDMQDMISLVFLNLKGCTSLNSLPEINLVSLETLILSNCSNLQEFRVISTNLEAVYLDGTSIRNLPSNINGLTRLVLMNLKGCTELMEFPDCLHDLRALKELILSDCLKLQLVPANSESINVLEILRLDASAVTEIPKISSLQGLCISKNDKISSLPDNISQFSQLKWLDVKYCKSLTSIPKLPPNLQRLDAHGCSSLKSVSNPLACTTTTQQIYSTFIFTNCNALEMSAKEEISSFSQRKCQLLSNALSCCNVSSDSEALFSTCFPGFELPSWLCHEAVGSELEITMPPHWQKNRPAGLALCAVVSFPDSQEQIKCFTVKCTFKLEVKGGSWIDFSFPVGSWSNQGNIVDNIASEHVFIGYISCSKICQRLENHHFSCSDRPEPTQSSRCSSTKAYLKFTVIDDTNEILRLEVLKCGLRFFMGVVNNHETYGVEGRPDQSLEVVTTSVGASPESTNDVEVQIETVPREMKPYPCSKPSKWACFACCNFPKYHSRRVKNFQST